MADIPDPAPTATTAAKLKAYSVGGPTPKDTRRLHLNEFRYSHSDKVIEALRSAYHEIDPDDLLTHYSSGVDQKLTEKLAAYVGIDATCSNVVVAAGSDEILRAVIDTCGVRGHTKLLMGVPGYTHFEHYARLRGLEIVQYPIIGPSISIPSEDHKAALLYHEEILAAGCLVYLCSPNNPTGDVWDEGAIEKLAKTYPKSFFLIDEAYIEFVSAELFGSLEDPSGYAGGISEGLAATALNYASASRVALALPNVIVARTMSKAFGLAALRIGYAVAHASTIATLQIAVSPKAFGPVASRVAVAALGDLRHYLRTTLMARREAKNMMKELRAMGWTCADGKGNFFLLYVGDPAATARALASAGVQVRNRDDLPGLSGFVRVTSGTPDDTKALLTALGSIKMPKQLPIQTFYTPKSTISEIKAMLRSVVGVLDERKIEHWAQGGTMLGANRHQGIPPWDTDADLAYAYDSSGHDPVASLVPAFAAKGLTLQRNRTNAYWQVGTNIAGGVISPIHIDVFSYFFDEKTEKYLIHDERYRTEKPDAPGADCDTSYTVAELFPLRKVPFYDITIKIPNKCEEVLTRALGADYMTTARIRTSETSHVEYPIRDRSPA